MDSIKYYTNRHYSDRSVLIRTVLLSIVLVALTGFVAVQATSDIELTGANVKDGAAVAQSDSNSDKETSWIKLIAEENKPEGAEIAKMEMKKDGAVRIYKITYTDGTVMLFDAGTGLPYYNTGSSEEKIIAYDEWSDNAIRDDKDDDNDKDAKKKQKELKKKIKQDREREIAAAAEAAEEKRKREEDRREAEQNYYEELEDYEEEYHDDMEDFERDEFEYDD